MLSVETEVFKVCSKVVCYRNIIVLLQNPGRKQTSIASQ